MGKANNMQAAQLKELKGKIVKIIENPSKCKYFAGFTGKVINYNLGPEFIEGKKIIQTSAFASIYPK